MKVNGAHISAEWIMVLLLLLSSVLGFAIQSYTHFQRIDDRLDRIEQVLKSHWKTGE